MSKRMMVTLPDGVAEVIEGAQRQSGATQEIPVLSQADVIRMLLRDAAHRLVDGSLMVEEETREITGIDGDALSELIDDNKLAKFLYEERKEDNWFIDMKGGFEGRVRDNLEERFGNGYDPEEAREFAESYIGEARDWWLTIEDDEQKFEEKKQFVLDRLEDYQRKYEVTTYDPNEEFLEGYSGVQDGHAEADIEDIEDEIRAIAEREFDKGVRSVDDVARAVALVYDVDDEPVREIIDEVRRQVVIEDQQRGSELAEERTPAFKEDGTAHDAEAKPPDHNREEPAETDAVDLDEQEAAALYGETATDGGQDESDDADHGDGPIADGGISDPGSRSYCDQCQAWQALDNGRCNVCDEEIADDSDDDVPPDVRDRIVEQLDHETIHGIAGSVRRGETSYLLVVYSQERHNGSVSQIRTVAVEPDAGTVKITGNGIWIPEAGGEILNNLGQLIAQASTVVEHGVDAEPMTRDSPDIAVDELLDVPMLSDEYRRPDEWGQAWGNGNGEPPETWDLVDRLDEAGLPTDRFSRLEYGAKTPHERYGFRPASDLMGNYGVETGLPAEADPDEMDERVLRGDQLVVVDVDYPEDAPLDELPETYAVSSANGSDERAHHYYRVPDKMDLHEALGGWKAQPGWGDIWLAGEYVVGPGCYDDESGGRYEVVADRPIETVGSDELLPLIQSDEDDLDDDPDEEVGDQDDNPEGEPAETDEDDDDTEEIVSCYRCDEELTKEAATFDVIDGAARWIHPGGCDDE